MAGTEYRDIPVPVRVQYVNRYTFAYNSMNTGYILLYGTVPVLVPVYSGIKVYVVYRYRYEYSYRANHSEHRTVSFETLQITVWCRTVLVQYAKAYSYSTCIAYTGTRSISSLPY